MTDTVLIANRGEIALRLVRACHGLGLRAVAVYSDADRNAPHVRAADLAVHIGPAEAAHSYLDIANLIAAARASGAGAIHPGYGFLAENADFAEACAAAGLIFVGPSVGVIRQMGSKIAAKAAAVAAQVPVVSGYHGDDQSDARLATEAKRIGTPLLIKASAGGGGRGMRQVHDLTEFFAALRSARGEAQAAFGSEDVLLERFVATGRHVEVQILADRAGNVRHLYERDCSLQRNHQKVIEEAPAPSLPDATRQGLLDSAVRLAQAIGYDSAGTVEFLVDAATGEFFFLEMNTRLQVEHPVTEAVTGIDIAAWQIRVALGEELDFAQKDIACAGWAVEARIAAEDPEHGYRPETGVISGYGEPALPGLRVDSGVEAGSCVSHYYDSMLAKLIAYGPDRTAALRLLDRGLAAFRLDGPGTNIAFLRDLIALPDFSTGNHHTGTLGVVFPEGWAAPRPGPDELAQAVLARILHDESKGSNDPWSALGGWRVTEPSGRDGAAWYVLEAGLARIAGRQGAYRIELFDGEPIRVENAALREGEVSFERDGIRRSAQVWFGAETVGLLTDTGRYVLPLRRLDVLNHVPAEGDGGNTIRAPMPGLVVEIAAAPGQTVAAGDPLVVIEAMKLLQTLRAPCSGTVAHISAAPGDTVDAGAVLLAIDSEDIS